MKIMIIGAGIGGLTTALALRRFGHQVVVYEKVAKIRPVGAAISVWSNGIKCLNYLGLREKVEKIGGVMESMAYINGINNQVMTQFSIEPLICRVGQRPYPISRAELQSMLLEAVGAENIFLNKKMTEIFDDGKTVTVTFADGSSDNAELLVAADGTHSFTREYVLEERVERRYAGYVNWNGLIEIDATIAPKDQWTTFVGEGKRVSLMPIAGKQFYFFFDVPLSEGMPNEREQYQKELKMYFSTWCEPVQHLIDKIDPQRTNRVEIYDIEPFDRFYRGRVALLGDAAHSTVPDLGQGACQAMEDAIYLAQSLQINTLGIEDALHRYQNKRNGRVKELVLRARKRCDITHYKNPEKTENWYAELYQEKGEHIIDGIARNIEGSPLD